MKKIFLIAFPLLFALACQKNEISPPANSLSVVIDGKTVDFKEIGVDSTQAYLGISATVDTSAFSPELSIVIFKDGPLTVGTYSVLTSTSGSSLLNYYERPAGIPTEYQSPNDSITITAINALTMTGTFHGACDYSVVDPNTFLVTLDPTRARVMTGGKFSVKLH